MLSAVITASFWVKVLPSSPMAAVPVAGVSGVIVPGCECASVPVASSLISKGVVPAAALTFLLASPAINPVVMVSTFVAFSGSPQMVFARFVASLFTAVIVGWLWVLFGRDDLLKGLSRSHLVRSSKTATFFASATHDIFQVGGFLVVGAAAAALINVFMPVSWLNFFADNVLLSVLLLALLAVLLSVCSEADAFVAASFSSFSPAAQLAFMVVGPMVDLKLISLQVGMSC